MRVTFLTVGEYPTVNGLHASQVLPFASYLQSQGVNVNWIAFVPIEMRLKDLLVNGGALLADMKKLAAQQGIDITVSIFPLTIVRAYSYVFRRWLIPLAGSKLVKMLQKNNVSAEPHIFHCRSYFAAAVALKAKKKNKNIFISFDMRSLLPPEIPVMFPVIGSLLYGGLKRWEALLLNEVDSSFLPSHRGIRLLEFEGVECLPTHINITGLEGPHNYNQEDKSSSKVIGYVGGFGQWQSIAVLEKVFEALEKYVADCSFDVVSSSTVTFKGEVKTRSLPHQEVAHAIGAMLAVVVPGGESSDNHFNKLISSYLFSTKAAEALSLGVPLIVNAQLNELADYVRSNRCGLVFSMKNGQPQFEGIDHAQLNNMDAWKDMRDAALRCSPEFIRKKVYEKYLKTWEEKYPKKKNINEQRNP